MRVLNIPGTSSYRSPSFSSEKKKSPAKSRRKIARPIVKSIVTVTDDDTFTPSVYQSGVKDFIFNKTGSCVIDAKAGSGKTSTIEWIAKQLPSYIGNQKHRVLMLAFNKSIAEELKRRMPDWIICGTFHSIGFRTWCRYIKNWRVKVSGNKVSRILKNLLDKKTYADVGSVCVKLIGLAKNNGIGTYIRCDTDNNWRYLIYHHCIDIGGNSQADGVPRETKIINICRQALQISNELGQTEIDFDDMLYLPLLNRVFFFRNDIVFVDEAQDTNPVQVALLKRMVKKSGRVIAVGDESQAIYGFRGADCDAIQNIVTQLNATVLPLSICYRCAKNIVTEAQKIVPTIESFDKNPDGTVDTLTSYGANDFVSGNAVLCRNTAPLIKFCYSLISRSIKAHVLGRDIGKGLIDLVNGFGVKTIPDMLKALQKWEDKRIEHLSAIEGKESAIGSVMDKAECIRVIAENMNSIFITDFVSEVNLIFSDDDSPGVQLATCHRSKGHEWDKVFILDRGLMPSRWVRIEWQKTQEANIEYVAITRAKKELYFINSDCWR